MPNWWFTSDLHFDHFNIIKLTNRPFNSIDDMNASLIRLWNAVVKGGDIVVVAGDFTLHHDPDLVAMNFTRHLNGSKIFIKGNHDYWIRGAAETRYLYHKKINGLQVAVGHYPMRTWKGQRRGGVNLHGHSHGTLPPLPGQLDIGVDTAAVLLGHYRPFSFNEIKYLTGG